MFLSVFAPLLSANMGSYRASQGAYAQLFHLNILHQTVFVNKVISFIVLCCACYYGGEHCLGCVETPSSDCALLDNCAKAVFVC